MSTSASLQGRAIEIDAAIVAATESADPIKLAKLKKQRRSLDDEIDVAVDVERVLARKAAEQRQKQREQEARAVIERIEREDGPALEAMAARYLATAKELSEQAATIRERVLTRRRDLMNAMEVFPGARNTGAYKLLFENPPPDVGTMLAAPRVYYGLATEPHLSRGYDPNWLVGILSKKFADMVDAAKRVLS